MTLRNLQADFQKKTNVLINYIEERTLEETDWELLAVLHADALVASEKLRNGLEKFTS